MAIQIIWAPRSINKPIIVDVLLEGAKADRPRYGLYLAIGWGGHSIASIVLFSNNLPSMPHAPIIRAAWQDGRNIVTAPET